MNRYYHIVIIFLLLSLAALEVRAQHQSDTAAFIVTDELTLDDDISADSVIFPINNSNLQPNLRFIIRARFQNVGLNLANNINFTAMIFDTNRNVVYSNTINDNNWLPDEHRNITFPPFSTPSLGTYTIVAFAKMSGDQNPYNDTTWSNFTVSVISSGISNIIFEESIKLYQNFPNPFATTTTINYTLPENGRVTLRIYDITGQVIQTEAENTKEDRGRTQNKS